jgi:hypothetical protein
MKPRLYRSDAGYWVCRKRRTKDGWGSTPYKAWVDWLLWNDQMPPPGWENS